MSWTATIQSVSLQGTTASVSVILSDGVSVKFQQSFTTDGTLVNLQAQARNCIANLTTVQAAPTTCVVGQTVDLTVPVVTFPVDPNPGLTNFRTIYTAYQRNLPLVSLGLTLAKTAPTAQQVVAAWDSSYTGLV